eukprot:144729-Hanusia_phi.AAC.1
MARAHIHVNIRDFECDSIPAGDADPQAPSFSETNAIFLVLIGLTYGPPVSSSSQLSRLDELASEAAQHALVSFAHGADSRRCPRSFFYVCVDPEAGPSGDELLNESSVSTSLLSASVTSGPKEAARVRRRKRRRKRRKRRKRRRKRR